MTDTRRAFVTAAVSALVGGLLTGLGSYVALSARLVRVETSLHYIEAQLQVLQADLTRLRADVQLRATRPISLIVPRPADQRRVATEEARPGTYRRHRAVSEPHIPPGWNAVPTTRLDAAPGYPAQAPAGRRFSSSLGSRSITRTSSSER